MKRLPLFLICAILAMTPTIPTADQAHANEFDPPVAKVEDDPARAFDFWLGEWSVNLRVKQEDQTWADERTATAKIYSVLGGRAILELWDENAPGNAIRGFSLRYYDEAAAEWKLYLNWPGRNRSGISGLSGTFRHGRGEFFSEYAIDDTTTMLSRYTFSDITDNSLRWDDAFSKDGGRTWTNNWIMEFTRTADSASWPEPGEPAHTYHDGGRCDLPEFELVKKLGGEWEGSNAGDVGICYGIDRAYNILDGCASILLLDYHEEPTHVPEFAFFSYNTYAKAYELAVLTGKPGEQFQSCFGEVEDSVLVFRAPKSAPAERRYTMQLTDTILKMSRRDLVGSSQENDPEWTHVYKANLKRKEPVSDPDD